MYYVKFALRTVHNVRAICRFIIEPQRGGGGGCPFLLGMYARSFVNYTPENVNRKHCVMSV